MVLSYDAYNETLESQKQEKSEMDDFREQLQELRHMFQTKQPEIDARNERPESN